MNTMLHEILPRNVFKMRIFTFKALKSPGNSVNGFPHGFWASWIFAAAAKSLQLCPTLCDPIDGSPPGSIVPGILQARTLEWVAISFSNVWKWKVKVKSLSRVRPSATPWTAAFQAPPSMGFSRQEYWSGVPLPSLVTLLEMLNFWEILNSINYHKLMIQAL